MNEQSPFQTQQVRDLAWACFCPPLILAGDLRADGSLVDANFTLTPQRRLWLETLDRAPQPLLEHLSHRRSHRLGIYFESLWQFFLDQDPAFELLAHNLPIHNDGRTLGEFDCLYFCRERQQVVHLELAVKFFLGFAGFVGGDDNTMSGNEPTSHAEQWLGPDAKDRLDLKLAHLLQRQTRLSDTPAAKAALATMDIAVGITEAAFRGYLFTPGNNPLPPPPGFNVQHPLSQWFTRKAIVENVLPEHQANAFTLLPKMQWLGPAQIDDANQILSTEQITALIERHFSADSYPLMIAALDAFGCEQHRFFVTHDGWPEPAAKTAAETANEIPQKN